MKKNKLNIKAFTLIELLAVILILGIIALIAIPVVSNIIKDAKKSSVVKSTYTYIRGVEDTYSKSVLKNEEMKQGFYVDEELSKINVDIKGTKPKKGELNIYQGKVSYALLLVNNMYVLYENNKAQVIDSTEPFVKYETLIVLDVARRYYTVDEIKSIIDTLGNKKNSALQLHFTDDENVGIESTYLNQTTINATNENGIYINKTNNKKFLSYNQVKEIMNYCSFKNVKFIPEIDAPAHMNGFFKLAEKKFGVEYVRNARDWDNPTKTGIAWSSGAEEGHLDINREQCPNGQKFLYSLYDEYTSFFKDCSFFNIGFDEYTLRIDEKVQLANELNTYLKEKGFKTVMWSDALTKNNYNNFDKDIKILYWGAKSENINDTSYATVPQLQEAGFNLLLSNFYYLFYIPSINNSSNEDLNYTISDISNSWTIEKWNSEYESSLNNYDNINGSYIAVWGEDSASVNSNIIINQTKNMYNAMYNKLR